ncbi:zinc knuckle domain-containing protein [Purpureocillium lavendulum]|uniref:Zinc knuckle domain-containing protein n=1 Tax=Purpureocillium lavendulum TaxID=1247861 RepID=A0AB34FCH0_9HYPO|nr:zinc knuckle domain-containing protein [Purpureocillium lavendulum]
MDWEPTKVGKHGSRGTQERKIGVHWAKEERRCFRCDRAGHIAAYCTRRPREQPGERSERPVGKAEHPQQRTKAAKVEPRDRERRDQDDDTDSQYETASDNGSENK